MTIFEQNKALFHNVDHHYSVISELCTADSCPTMTGPGSAVFLWVDERGKKIKCSAPQYIGQFLRCQMVTLELTERASEAYDVFMANNKMAQK